MFCVVLSGCALSFWSSKNKPDSKNQPQAKEDLVKPQIAIDSKIGPSVKIPPKSDGDKDRKQDSESSAPKEDTGKSRSAEEQNAKSKQKQLAASSEEDSSPVEPSFQKHDHSKYKERIKNKAIDNLNKHREATYATLCRDTMTDLWTLTIYRKKKRSFSFISFFWDEIDGKWEKGFDSGKMPLKRWKGHLRYSRSQKACTVLKGGHLARDKPDRRQ